MLLSLKKIKIAGMIAVLAFMITAAFSGAVTAEGILDVTAVFDGGQGCPPGVTMPADQVKALDEDLILPDINGVPSGYVLAGWSFTDVHGQTTEYKVGDKVKPQMNEGTNTAKFVAIWEYVITYDAHMTDIAANVTGLPVEMPSAAAGEKYKIDVTLKDTAGSYDFLGWNTEANKDNETAQYKAGDSIEISSPVTLYAAWKAKFFRVIYHANTGDGNTDAAVIVPVDENKYMGSNLKVTILGAGKVNKNGTAAQTSGDSSPDSPSQNSTSSEQKPSVPETEENPASSSDLVQTGSVEPSGSLVKVVDASSDSDLTPSASDSASISTDAATDSELQTETADTSTSSSADTTSSTDVSKITDVVMTRDGYTFAGWATDPAATTALYKPGDVVTLTQNLDLYAVWTKGTSTTSTTPQTGDEAELYLYTVMALLSLGGIFYLLNDRKKAKDVE